jgi:hypothetical protein
MSAVFAYGAQHGVEFEGMTEEVREARKNRRVNARLARQGAFSRTATAGPGGASAGFSDIQFATGRPRDPLFYWRQNNLPYDFSQNEELAKVRAFTRLLYTTDPIIGSCVDIFSRFPILGGHVECKDNRIEDFYGEAFYDEDHLDYEEFLEDTGREYYIAGEAWPFGTFNEDLGIWDNEELLNADDIKVERSPFLKDPRYFIKLPWTIRQVLQTRQPVWEYNRLVKEYPELTAYTSENSFMPVSNILLNQIKFKADTFNVRGIPLLTRAMRSVLQQEMLNTAMDAIADRLYTPLILCKLGASATDLGTTQPWIPDEDDLENFELALDAALAGDFRALIYNFAVTMENVFGREQMPDLTPDFERIEDRILQTFGLSRTFLTGAQEGQTYAADALNKGWSQLMGRQQKRWRSHFRKRAKVIAEAQEHYDYNEHGGKRYVITEEVLEQDEETGEKRLVEQPKLLVPDLRFKVLNLKDEDTTRQFIEALRASGIPISQRTRTRGLELDLDEESEISQDEAVEQAVAEQETRKRQYLELRQRGLPITDELRQDFDPQVQVEDMPPMGAAPPGAAPRQGMEDQSIPTLAPGPEDEELEEPEPGEEAEEAEEGPPPGEQSQRPPESDEEREGMPTAASRKRRPMPSQAALWRRTAGSRAHAEAAREEDAERREELLQVLAAGESPPLETTHWEQVQDGKQIVARAWQSGDAPAYLRDPDTTGYRARVAAGTDLPDGEQMYGEAGNGAADG